MRLTFIETHMFRVSMKGVLDDDDLRELGDTLLENPEAGAPIPRTGGARKIRRALEGGGKSGGARVVYYYHEEAARIYYLLVYPKPVAVNISEAGRAVLKKMIREIKGEE
jgi:hypothetical protein